MRSGICVLVVILGLVIGGLIGAGIVILSPSLPLEGSFVDEYIIPHTEEQVSIQEEELEVIGRYDLGAFLSVWKIHDNKDNVTCWTTNTEGISCIPDHMLTP
jgi:hypothetical protein